jgi:hypothetical protein
LIGRQEPSNLGNTEDGLGRSKTTENQTIWSFTIPDLNGSNYSSMLMVLLRTSNLREFLTLLEVEMKKVRMSKSGREMVQRPRHGRFFMKTRKKRLKPRVSMKNSALKSTDHST